MLVGAKALVVAEEQAVRDVAQLSLRGHGFECRSAADAGHALSLVAQDPPALVICDIGERGDDRIWLLRELKQRWPETAVMILTGAAHAPAAVESLRRGADDCLTKPLNPVELCIRAERAVQRLELIRRNREQQRNRDNPIQPADSPLELTFECAEPTTAVDSRSRGSIPLREGPVPARDLPMPGLAAAGRDRVQPEDPEKTRRNPPETARHQKDHELPLLGRALTLLVETPSPIELGEAMATQLLDSGAAFFVCLWRPGRQRQSPEAVIRKGAGSEGQTSARDAASRRATLARGLTDGVSVWAPIVARGLVEGVLEVHWGSDRVRDPEGLTEKLALCLAIAFSRERNAEEARRTTRELDLFYEIASASRYTLDIAHLATFITDSLHRIIECDLAGLLLLGEPPSLHIKSRLPIGRDLLDRVRAQMLSALRLTCGVEPEEELDIQVSDAQPENLALHSAAPKPRSFINIPLTVGGSVAGLIHVSSGKEDAFGEEHALFLNRVASFLARSVQGIQELLAAVRGRMEKMVEHMNDGVLMLDRRGDVVAMNGAAHRILRIDAANRRVAAAELTRALELDPLALLRIERRNQRRLLSVHGVTYQAQLSPVEDVEGQLAGAVIAFRNFTEEKKIDEMKSEFINIVSHELRTPLTAVKNAVGLVLGKRLGDLNDKQRHFVELAERNIDQLIEMVNDLLDLSKIESGKMHIALEPLDIRRPMESVVSSLAPRALEKDIRLETRIGPDLPCIYGDETSIERVLVNLVGNALKFTDRGGRVEVAAEADWDGSGDARRQAISVTVSDTGIGIPKDHLESIFDRFAQVDSTRRQDVAGTGLGLPIARELVHAHHGRIWAESELGQGSRFRFVIPVLTPDELFFRGLERDIDRARRLPAQLTLVLVRLENAELLRQEQGEERYQHLLTAIDRCARRAARRSTDRVELRRQEAELVAVLLDTPLEGGRGFGARLTDELRAAVPESEVATELSCTCALFPEEAATAQKLYRLAQERAGAPAPAPHEMPR